MQLITNRFSLLINNLKILFDAVFYYFILYGTYS